jgi:hypothetical protein
VLYAWVRPEKTQSSVARGLGFGSAFFLIVDEGLNTVLGFTPPPQEFPWQAHARGAVAHLAYGVVCEGVLRGFSSIETVLGSSLEEYLEASSIKAA